MIGKKSMKIITWKRRFMEDISDADDGQAYRVCKDFEIKNVVEYHDLHVQRDTLQLADAFGKC